MPNDTPQEALAAAMLDRHKVKAPGVVLRRQAAEDAEKIHTHLAASGYTIVSTAELERLRAERDAIADKWITIHVNDNHNLTDSWHQECTLCHIDSLSEQTRDLQQQLAAQVQRVEALEGIEQHIKAKISYCEQQIATTRESYDWAVKKHIEENGREPDGNADYELRNWKDGIINWNEGKLHELRQLLGDAARQALEGVEHE